MNRTAFGIYKDFRDPVLLVDELHFIFAVGGQIVSYNLLSGKLDTYPRRHGNSPIQAMAISKDRKYFVVIESSGLTNNDMHVLS